MKRNYVILGIITSSTKLDIEPFSFNTLLTEEKININSYIGIGSVRF